MQEQPTTRRPPQRRQQRPSYRTAWVVSLLAVTAVLAILWRLSATRMPVHDVVAAPTEGPGLGFNPDLEADLGIGDIAHLADGAVARLNDVQPDAPLPATRPAPDPGMELVRLDVELCAGTEELFVDAALWLGVDPDQTVHSAHLGLRDLQTLSMAPGACQRGSVDIAVPAATTLEAVLLSDTTHATVARWSLRGRARAAEPLSSEAEPTTSAVREQATLVTGGSVTLHRFKAGADRAASGPGGDRRRTFRITGEVCAGDDAFVTSPRFWFVQLDDHRLIPAQRDAATTSRTLNANDCHRGSVDFSTTRAAAVVAVIYATGGMFPGGRWHVGG